MINYLEIFANITITKGFLRSLIIDSISHRYSFISNDAYEIFEFLEKKSIVTTYKYANKEKVDYVLDFSTMNNIGRISHAKPIKNNTIQNIGTSISNVVFEYTSLTNYLIFKYNIIYQLNLLKFNSIQIILPDILKKFEIENLKFFLRSLHCNSIYISINEKFLKNKKLIKAISKNILIIKVFVHTANQTKFQNSLPAKFLFNNGFINPSCCGTVSPKYFTTSAEHINESKTRNTCLNRKITIDAIGDIKNCPGMDKSYGNIKDISIADAIESPIFKDIWHTHKDKIAVCKDCEFRHICTDCRAYVENPSDHLSKPLKCGYNPYTNKWEEWSTNPLKLKAIKHYKL